MLMRGRSLTARSFFILALFSFSLFSISLTFASRSALADAIVPLPACGSAASASGIFFQSYEAAEYSPSGLLTLHFKINPSFTQGRTFASGWDVKNDECVLGKQVANPTFNATLPAGKTDFSFRFDTPTHYQLWDDASNTPVVCPGGQFGCAQTLPTYPSYYTFAFKASISLLGTNTFQSSFFPISQSVTAPPLSSASLPTPIGCAAYANNNGYFFDNYEHAEYATATNLLVVHYRLKSPFNDGRLWKSRLRTHSAPCVPSPSTFPNTATTGFTPYLRYWSLRFDTPTHWQLWNDELNTPETCATCEGTIAPGALYVSLAGDVVGSTSNFFGTPYPVTNPTPTVPETPKHSSVVFIPGIEASRLYKPGPFGPIRLWEPLTRGDVRSLFLGEQGEPVTPGIYVGSIIDTTPSTSNIYESFIGMMNQLVAEGTINAWQPLPYDWRADYNDLLASGTLLADGTTERMQDVLEQLAATSQTGKVTIIAHSHGGLVAKSLISQLVAAGKGNLVDQLILVASPQSGTPEAIAGLLHGENSFTFPGSYVVSRPLFRSLGEHAQAAFNLLPSPAYFARVQDPVIEFDPSSSVPQVAQWRSLYGPTIHDAATLQSFLSGSDGRPEPSEADVTAPNVLLPQFLTKAASNATAQDAWQPPSGVKVTQVVGWGLETLKGIKYTDRVECVPNPGLTGCTKTNVLDWRPQTTTDGDKTVISYSADKMATTTWYVDLHKYNQSTSIFVPLRDHASVFEVPDTLNLVRDSVLASTTIPGAFTFAQKPIDDNPANRLSVHSPVSIDVYDLQNRHTGLVQNPDPNSDLPYLEEQIPNSRYYEFGEGKYVSLPQDGTYNVVIRGTGEGTFTLESERGIGGEYAAPVSEYQDVPVDTSSIATLTVSDTGAVSALALDVDGDGTSDVTVGKGESISAASLLDILEYQVGKLEMKPKDIKKFDKQITKVRKAVTKQKVDNATKRLDNITKEIQKSVTKGKLTAEEAGSLVQLIIQIKNAIQ